VREEANRPLAGAKAMLGDAGGAGARGLGERQTGCREAPQDAIRDVIRVGGFSIALTAGQTSRSRALVRHGADAREAIAAVLEVPAVQIGVRDNAG
jgi:hypothetical protein